MSALAGRLMFRNVSKQQDVTTFRNVPKPFPNLISVCFTIKTSLHVGFKVVPVMISPPDKVINNLNWRNFRYTLGYF